MSREQQITCGARHSMTGVFCELDARHAGDHFGEDSHARVLWPVEPTSPATPQPETPECRVTTVRRVAAVNLTCWRCGTASYQPNDRCDSHMSWADRLQTEIEHHNAWRKRADEAEREVVQHQQTIQQQAAQIATLLTRERDLENALVRQEGLKDVAERTTREQAAQIETLTQALKGVKSIQRGYLCWCDGSWNNVEHGHQPKCQKATEAISGASRPTEGEQGRLGNYYGRRLTASIEDGQVLVAIGVQTLAHAVAYADWANPFDEASDDYIRTFAIADAGQFAKDVVSAMLAEREDGSTPLSDFLDKMSQAAIEDGSLGLHEDEHRIKHGETAPCETWAEPEQGAPQ